MPEQDRFAYMSPEQRDAFRRQLEAEIRQERQQAQAASSPRASSPTVPRQSVKRPQPSSRPVPIVVNPSMTSQRPATTAIRAEQASAGVAPEQSRSKRGRYLVVGGLAAGLVLTALFAKGDLSLDKIKNGLSDPSAKTKSTESQAYKAAAVGPEGLNRDNCQKDGAGIVTAKIQGYTPLIYQLKKPDGTTVTPKPYLNNQSAVDAINQQLSQLAATNKTTLAPISTTESGYPQLQYGVNGHDLDVVVNACVDDGVTATTETADGMTVDLSKIKFSMKPVDPVYQSANPNNINVAWPIDPFISLNSDIYTDASVKAAVDAHKADSQFVGVFNTGISAFVQEASDASADSKLNQMAIFDDGNSKTMFEAIKDGLAARLGGNGKVSFSGNVGTITPQLTDVKPTQLTWSKDGQAPKPEDEFILKRVEIMLGDQTVTATPTPTPTETN